MEPGDAILLGVVAVLASNHVLLRLPGWETRRGVFYAAQLLNLAVAIYVMAFGIPALHGPLKVFNWVFGLLFIVRVVQNNNAYAKARREWLRKQRGETDDKKAAMLDALRRGEARDDDGPATQTGPQAR